MKRISGLIQTTENFHHLFSRFISHPGKREKLSFSQPEVIRLHQEIKFTCERVESLCKKNRCTPADLPNPSYRAYQWIKFLTQKKWLLAHLYALEEFYDLAGQVKPGMQINHQKLDIRIAHFNYLFRSKLESETIRLEFNEGFLSAPKEIKGYLIQSTLKRRNRKILQAIKSYSSSSDYEKITKAIHQSNSANSRSYKGKHMDIKALFDQINLEYFEGKLKQPRLIWSARRSNRRLGYYDPQSNTITINRRFDTSETPPLLVEYILYHEMLHQSLGIREVNGRRYAHTAAFKKAEKRFKAYEEAEKLVKRTQP